MTTPMAKTVLFLCSGNYYRSRFAEILFNHLANEHGLHAIADSRGLRLSVGNVGPISSHAIDELTKRDIPFDIDQRFPLLLTTSDLEAADLVIAVKAAEHRPMIAEQYPDWLDRIEYWHIHDVGDEPAETALARLDQDVRALIQRLKE